MVDIYNGAKCTTVSHGEIQPTTSPIIPADFNMEDEVSNYSWHYISSADIRILAAYLPSF